MFDRPVFTRLVFGPDRTRQCSFQQSQVLASIWQGAIQEILFLNRPAAEVFLHNTTLMCQALTLIQALSKNKSETQSGSF